MFPLQTITASIVPSSTKLLSRCSNMPFFCLFVCLFVVFFFCALFSHSSTRLPFQTFQQVSSQIKKKKKNQLLSNYSNFSVCIDPPVSLCNYSNSYVSLVPHVSFLQSFLYACPACSSDHGGLVLDPCLNLSSSGIALPLDHCFGGLVVRCPSRQQETRGLNPTFSGRIMPVI